MEYWVEEQKMMDYPEGATPLDPDELEGLKFKHITTREELNHLEQANIQSGLLWLKRKKQVDLLTEHFIKEVHKKLFGEVWKWAGTYRKTEKSIGVDPLQIQIQLHQLLADVHFWIEHKIYSLPEIALRFHHKLVFIHLFPNGNGRHARIITDELMARKFALKEIDWVQGAELQLINARRALYIAALRAADQHDYTLLLKFAGY